MKKILAAALLLAVFACPAFASKKIPREHHQHYNYKYKAPKKFKAPKAHHHQPHPHSAHKSQSN